MDDAREYAEQQALYCKLCLIFSDLSFALLRWEHPQEIQNG